MFDRTVMGNVPSIVKTKQIRPKEFKLTVLQQARGLYEQLKGKWATELQPTVRAFDSLHCFRDEHSFLELLDRCGLIEREGQGMNALDKKSISNDFTGWRETSELIGQQDR